MTWFYDAKSTDPLNGSGPGFARYTQSEFDRLAQQRNIMVFVGNGFDLQVLQDYNCSVDSRYETFFHYLKMRGFNPCNALFEYMHAAYQRHLTLGGHENWSDIEAAVATALKEGAISPEVLRDDLRAIQAVFARFLQSVVPSGLLDKLGTDACDHAWSVTSLTEFLADIADRDEYLAMRFPKHIVHYTLFNFKFVNFNYTTLLDNYIYLDQKQFDPLASKTVDTHLMFKDDPHTYRGGDWDAGQSSYFVADVVHPHGILSTPRSLLFGIDAEDEYKKSRGPRQLLKKAYWSQAHALYRAYFVQADLFIIFGCSLGESDGWWWRNIVRGLKQKKQQQHKWRGPIEEQAELIIYWYWRSDEETVDWVKNHFFTVAGILEDNPDRKDLEGSVHVVIYTDQTPRTFLRSRAAP